MDYHVVDILMIPSIFLKEANVCQDKEGETAERFFYKIKKLINMRKL